MHLAMVERLRCNDAKLTSADFTWLGEAGATEVADALAANSQLTYLSVCSMHMGDAGAAAIAGVLREHNTSLTGLDLGRNEMSDWGGSRVAEMLIANHSIRNLNLSFNFLADAGACALAAALAGNSSLATLDVSFNRITARGGRALAEQLTLNPALTELFLMDNDIGEGVDQMAVALSANSCLKTLQLACNKINAAGARSVLDALESNATLTDLSLAANKFGDDGVRSMSAANATLTRLDLSSNRLTEVGVGIIAGGLAINSSLQVLNLACNRLGSKGVKQLSEALRCNQTLKILDLHSCRLGDECGGLVADFLATNSTLTELELRGNELKEGGAGRIGLAIAARPRPPGGEFALTGVRLGRLKQLGLPPDSTGWSNEIVLRFLWEQHERRAAFCMLAHPRLGEASMWSCLEVGVLRMVLSYPTH